MASKLIRLRTSFKTNKSAQCTPFRVSIFLLLLLLLLGILNIQSVLNLGIRRDPPLFELSHPKSQCSTNSTHHLLLHTSQIGTTSSSAWDSQHHAAYEVCVVIVIGHDSGKPSETALPFSVLRRLFQMVFELKGIEGEEVGLVEHDLQGVLVRVDYTSVVCKMVRDALGHSATCQSLLNLPKSKQQAKCKTLVVGETKKYIEQACAKWTDRFQYEDLKIVDLDEPDDPAPQVTLPSMATWRPTIVTGFSRNHLHVGLLLLRSIGKAASSPIVSKLYNVSLVVWVMEEFNSSETKNFDCIVWELKEVYHIDVEVRKPNFMKYPDWMRINPSHFDIDEGGRGEYAWKALFIHTTLVERGFMLWLDGGSRIVKASALLNTLNWVKAYGFASRKSEGRVERWTHIAQLKYLQADFLYLKEQQNCDASCIGFTTETYQDLLQPWYECSITRQCIAPDGSNRFNHRQDQSALTVLSVLTQYSCTGIDNGITRHNDHSLHEMYQGVDTTHCYKDPVLVT